MLNTLIPTLIRLLEFKGVNKVDILEISLNEKHDKTYVLTNHVMDYCRTNQYRGTELYTNQFHAIKKNDVWAQAESGCGHATFVSLNHKNIQKDWADNQTIERR